MFFKDSVQRERKATEFPKIIPRVTHMESASKETFEHVAVREQKSWVCSHSMGFLRSRKVRRVLLKHVEGLVWCVLKNTEKRREQIREQSEHDEECGRRARNG